MFSDVRGQDAILLSSLATCFLTSSACIRGRIWPTHRLASPVHWQPHAGSSVVHLQPHIQPQHREVSLISGSWEEERVLSSSSLSVKSEDHSLACYQTLPLV